ncbi:MAG: glycosyltransferase family 4 protein [Candidatus Hydrogenedentes bacterium]|nr:glycosyltransferase family 4 protein [Candidatus Hydrogenedentota bacterium]
MTPTPLHILITDPHLGGGGQVRYVSNLAAQLVRLGHKITIGCRPGSILVNSAAAAGCPALDMFAFRGGVRPGAWRNDLQNFRRYIRAEKPDIIHVSSSQDHWAAAFTNMTLGRPVCILRTRHNTYAVANNLPNRILNRRWTDYQIVVCDVVRRDLARHPAFDGERLCTIHNGVDATLFTPSPEVRAQARAEFGYTPAHLVLGIAARLVDAKGHAFLFRAAALLKDQLPQLRILCFGQGVKEPQLRQLAGDLGIGPIVQFAGFRDDMHQCTQAFDIGVQPSIDCDTSSFSLKEQMVLEMPVIASDYGGLVELIDDGVEGLIVPTGSVEPLAAAIASLAGDPARRSAMGKAGRDRVLRDFTVEVFALRTVEAYARALAIAHDRRGT